MSSRILCFIVMLGNFAKSLILIRFCFCLGLYFATLSELQAAERIPYCGVNFSVDSLKSVDSENVLVRLGGEESIIARTSLEHWVAERVFLSDASLQKISTKELEDFVSQCAQSDAVSVVAAALREILRRGEKGSFSPRAFSSQSPNNLPIIKEALSQGAWEKLVRDGKSVVQTQLLADALVEILVVDPEWIKFNALRLVYLLSEPINASLLVRIQEELEAENQQFLAQLAHSIEVIGGGGLTEPQLYQRVASLAKSIIKQPFNVGEMRGVVLVASESPALLDVVYPKISNLCLKQVDQFLARNQIEAALSVMSVLLPSRRTPETLSTISKTITALLTNNRVIIPDRVEEIFQAAAISDPQVRRSYQRLLEQRIEQALIEDRITETEAAFSRLIFLRPDPNPANDAIRFTQALRYQQQGLSMMASDKLAQIVPRLSLSQRLQFAWASAAIGLGLFVALFLVVFSSFGFVLYQRGLFPGFSKAPPKVEKKENKVKERREAREDVRKSNSEAMKSKPRGPSQEGASAFVKMDAMRSQTPVLHEYEAKLAVFALAPDSSLKAIKSAYRAAVKDCHPDLNPKHDEAQIERFAELTRTYEEVLELRRQLGLPDS